jgi:hypothetical protein
MRNIYKEYYKTIGCPAIRVSGADDFIIINGMIYIIISIITCAVLAA